MRVDQYSNVRANAEVANGLLFQVEGSIPLSSDPTFHFFHGGPCDGAITVVARDTDGGAFRRQFPAPLATVARRADKNSGSRPLP